MKADFSHKFSEESMHLNDREKYTVNDIFHAEPLGQITQVHFANATFVRTGQRIQIIFQSETLIYGQFQIRVSKEFKFNKTRKKNNKNTAHTVKKRLWWWRELISRVIMERMRF